VAKGKKIRKEESFNCEAMKKEYSMDKKTRMIVGRWEKKRG
jgi:hypothetical protein